MPEQMDRPTRWNQVDRVVVVTGAGSGIGRATAVAFASAGARVLAADLNPAAADETADVIRGSGGRAESFAVDVRDLTGIEAMLDRAELALGPVDVLVSNAGTGIAANVVDTTEEELDRVLDVNVKGVFFGAKAAVPRMVRHGGGVIVNVASAVAFAAVPERAAYIASKGAILALTRSIALDFMGAGIRCNCVAPGVVDSPWVGSILASNPDPALARTRMVERQPLGRIAQPIEIANAILYLASDEASFIHGSCLVIDGGFSIR
jgi:NAD(P)-dependent dehydrogenase (short-subunit alcohol dehydrogenase family)